MTKCDARGRDHVVRFTRPSGSVFAYCKRSKTGAGEGLGTRLGRHAHHACDKIDQVFVSGYSKTGRGEDLGAKLAATFDPV